MAQREMEIRWGDVDERAVETSCREVAASCRKGVTRCCQSRSRGIWAVRRPPGLRSWALGRRCGCTSAESNPPPKLSPIFMSRVSSRNFSVWSCLLKGELTSLPGLLQLAIAFLKDDVFPGLAA